MTTKEDILVRLEKKRGRFVSGEELARDLVMSRNCIWKGIRALRADGYRIDSEKGVGYRLADDDNGISAAGIAKHAGDGFNITALEETDSTNTRLKLMAEAGAPEWSVVTAARQTAGRGRMGRSFYSPKATGLYISILTRPAISASEALMITTAAAVATARAIESETRLHAGIKWVNDIYINGRKVCGILTEAAVDLESGGLRYAVVGIGVNISDPPEGFPADIAAVAGSLTGRKPAAPEMRNRLAGGILREFASIYRLLPERPFMDEYRARSTVIGKDVDVISAMNRRAAHATGIDDDAHLLVRYEDGTTAALGSGEVSVRTR